MTASSPLFQPAVQSHEPAPRSAADRGRSVLRRLPARAFGVILSAAGVLRSAEAWAAQPVSSLDLRLVLPGTGRPLGSLRDLLGASRPVAFVSCLAFPMRLTGQS